MCRVAIIRIALKIKVPILSLWWLRVALLLCQTLMKEPYH